MEEEDGAVDNNDQEWSLTGTSLEEEQTTKDKEEIPQLNANDIKYELRPVVQSLVFFEKPKGLPSCDQFLPAFT